jgi:SAM-dependent methyltransferase
MMNVCPDCDTVLRQDAVNEYVDCPGCGTYVLQACASAEAENAAYFNAHFRETAANLIDERKRRVFQEAETRDHARRAAEQNRFLAHLRNLQAQLVQGGQRVLEIGFGDGSLLASLLQAGTDAWGEDLSETALDNFQRMYPAFANRVAQPGTTPGDFNIIYGAALFEHLDAPRAFLHAAHARLRSGGSLVLDQIPLVVASAADLTPSDDICFWKPCHRVLHTQAGLQHLALATGYSVASTATMDSFNYRVLSLHRRAGFPAIEDIRNSCLADTRLPGLLRYRWICWRARHIRSRCHVASIVLRPTAGAGAQGASSP